MMKFRAAIIQLCVLILMIGVSAFVSSEAFGQAKKKAVAAKADGASKGVAKNAMAPEALSAKALLEDLLARRYAQALSTKVDREAFSVSAQLDLLDVPPRAVPKPADQPVKEQEPLSDLMLGTLDPEALIKSFTGPEEKLTAQKFLENYKIRSVEIYVGLSETLSADVKVEVEKWLTDRVNSEFGKNGKGSVSLIRAPTVTTAKETPAPKGLWDLLSQFQSLAGQLVLAGALILGVLLWQILQPRKTADASSASAQAAPPVQAGAAAAVDDGKRQQEEDARQKRREAELEGERAIDEIARLTAQLSEVLPKVSKDLESIMRSWCQMGEPGWLRLASFAEVVGRQIGKLPIPVDALSDVTKMFAKMSSLSVIEKRDALQKAYWDLLSVLNLGPSALDQPFGYLGGFNVGMVSQVLMEQNPKMKTLVSLFMPPDLRSKYMRSLTLEAKKQLLESAAAMSEIPADELKMLDGSLMTKFKPQGRQDVVPLEMTLSKIVMALQPVEEVVLLSGMTGPAVQEYKINTPSLAFLGEWPDDKISILLQRSSPDELVAFCRVRPDLATRLLGIAPQMTSEMAREELVSPDKMNLKDKNQWIEAFSDRMKSMIASKELAFEEIFATDASAQAPQSQEARNVKQAA